MDDTIDDILLENDDGRPALYSKKAILVSAFMAGPLAAAVMLRRNFIELGHESKAKEVLAGGILVTLAIAAFLVFTPENVIDKFPNVIFPVIYVGIVHILMQRTMLAQLDEHEREKGPYFSTLRVIGVAALYSVINVAVIVVPILTTDFVDQEEHTAYSNLENEFFENEKDALELFELFNNEASDQEILNFVSNVAIPLWDKNLAIVREMGMIDGLDQDYRDHQNVLLHYVELRREQCTLIKEDLTLGTWDEQQHEELAEKINAVVDSY